MLLPSAEEGSQLRYLSIIRRFQHGGVIVVKLFISIVSVGGDRGVGVVYN